MDEPRIEIIIINWNGKYDTLECLESIDKIQYDNFGVIVVDNGSKDGSVEAIRNKFPKVFLVEARKNLGFAGGNNLGIKHSLNRGAEFIFLLNNDTIVNENILGKMVEATQQRKRTGIFGAKIYYYSQPNRIWYAGAERRKNQWIFAHVGYGAIDEKEGDKDPVRPTDYVCGCALFIGTDLLKQIGLFDEKYFLLFEETDLCYRAKKMDIPSFLVPAAKVWHKASASFGGEKSPKYQYFFMRNKLLWAEKNLSLIERLGIYKIVWREIASCLNPINLKRPVSRAKINGFRDYLFRRFGNRPGAF